MTNALTPRQNEVLIFIRAHVKAHGIAPSCRQMGAAIGTSSTSQIAYIMDTLAWRGFIKRDPKRARHVQLLQSEDYHTPDCDCDGCAHGRYIANLKLVQALQVAPKFADHIKLTGLRILTHLERLDWRYRDNSRVRRKPLLSAAKATNNTLHQRQIGAV